MRMLLASLFRPWILFVKLLTAFFFLVLKARQSSSGVALTGVNALSAWQHHMNTGACWHDSIQTLEKWRAASGWTLNILWDSVCGQQCSLSCFPNGYRETQIRSKQTPVVASLHTSKHNHWRYIILSVAVFTFVYVICVTGCTLVQDCNVKLLWCTLDVSAAETPIQGAINKLLNRIFLSTSDVPPSVVQDQTFRFFHTTAALTAISQASHQSSDHQSLPGPF